MNALEFLDRPEARPIVAAFGDDVYLRHEVVEAAIGAALGGEADELAVRRFEGERAGLADVLDEVRTLPFLAKRRVVVVEGADPFITAHRKALEGFAERPSESGVLVLSVRTWPGTTKLAKTVARTGIAVDCRAPAERELPAWVARLARSRFGTTIDREAAAYLVDLVGAEAGLLASEVEKLSIFVGDRKAIGREDVATMVDAGRTEAIWGALDAALAGHAGAALAGLDRLVASGEAPVGLLAAVRKSLARVHHAGQLRLARRDLKEACREAGIPPFAVEKVGKQHAHLGPSRVARIPDLLLQADLDLKGSSSLPPRVVLERLLVRLARPRED